MTLETQILMAFLLVTLIALAWMIRLLLAQYAKRRTRYRVVLTPAPTMDPKYGCTRPWVIVNPSKHADLNAFKAQVEETAAGTGVSQIQWCEASIKDPGTGQALRTVTLDASLMIATGGDGTVRAVAAGLTGVGARMGIIPVGTGNPLAQNPELPIDDVPVAMRVALDNEHRLVDCGWLRVGGVEESSSLPAEGMLVRAAHTCLRVDERIKLPELESPPSTDECSFVVISSLGFNGETMAKTDSELKKRIDWVAYIIAALGTMTTARTGMRVVLRRPRPSDDPVGDAPTAPSSSGAVAVSAILEGEELSDALEQEMAWIESKSLMFANCGNLPYMTLAPGAHLDNGPLDVIAAGTRAGLLGWVDPSWGILFQRLGLKTFNLANSTGQIHPRQAEGVSVRAHTPQAVQADGGLVGAVMTAHARIDQGVLDVSVPKVLWRHPSAGSAAPSSSSTLSHNVFGLMPRPTS